MEEDVSDLLGTEERLEKFATEYVKLPVLWNKDDKNYKNKRKRATARRLLARALGGGAAGGVGGGAAGGGLVAAIHEFRARLQQEMVSACAEAARRGGAEGGCWGAARALLPPWARVGAACLPQPQIKPPAPTKPVEKPKLSMVQALAFRAALSRRVVRGVRRAARAGEYGARAFRRVAAALAQDVAAVQQLWSSMQRAALHKLRSRSWRSDTGEPLSALEWAVVDLAIIYGGVPVLNTMHYQHYKALRGLLAAFHLVQRFGLEPAPGEPPPRAQQWLRAAHWYSRDQGRAAISAVALQRRWFELRADTRRRLQAAWRQRGEGEGEGEPDAKDKVLALHEAIARRYPHVVTEALPTWSHMLKTNQLAPPTNECGPVPGETVHTSALTDSDSDATGDDRVIEDEKRKVFNADETNAQKNDSEVVTTKAQFGLQAIETPNCKPKNSEKSDLETTHSDSNRNLKLEKNAAPVKPDPKTKDSMNDNVDCTDSDGDLQIDESIDPSENVVKALQKLNPRTVQATIVFISDDEDAPNDAGEEIKRTNKIQTKKVERPKENINSHVEKRETMNKNADPSTKKKSRVKADRNCKNDNESHTSISQKVRRRSKSSDSDDDVLVIDDCKEDENDDLNNADRITAAIEQEMFRDTSNGSSNKDEVISRDDSSVKLSNAVDSNSTAGRPYQNPLLSHLLNAKYDDVFERYQAITNVDTISKSLTAENVLKRDELQQELAMNIKAELLGHSVNASKEENFEGGIDPKLLIYPVVLLTKLEDVLPKQLPESLKPQTSAPRTAKLSPKLLANKRHIETLSTLSETFFSIKKNIELLKACQPCVVMLVRGEEKRSRVSKRVELPDIEEVRRNNKRMLTAQVAPLAHQKSAGSKRGAGGEGGEGAAPSREELQRLLDDFAGARPEVAVCKSQDSDSAAACGCSQCVWRLLAAPAASGAVSKMQVRLLQRAATHAKRRRKLEINAEKKRRRAQRKKRPSPPPAPAPAPRAPSPYDAERAAREWLREKNVAAEKFGVKPRCFKKKPVADDPATLTPLTRADPSATLTLNGKPNFVTVNQATTSQPPRSDGPPGAEVAPAPSRLAYLSLSEENSVRDAQNQPILKSTPTPSLFNVDAVADINKKLGDLASNDRPEATTVPTFSPIITNVQSLAREERPPERKVQQICWLSKKASDESAPSRNEPRPFLTVTSTRLNNQTVPKIVLNKSQLKTLPTESRSLLNPRALSDVTPRVNTVDSAKTTAPPWHVAQTMQETDGTALKMPNQTNVMLKNNLRVDPAGLVLNDTPNQLKETPTGPVQAGQSQADAQAPLSLQLNSVYSGPPLSRSLQTPWMVTSVQPSTPAIVVGSPSSISQTTFENLTTTPFGLNLNQNVLRVNSVQGGPPPPLLSAVQVGSQLQLVLTPQQINALQPGQVALLQTAQQMQSVPLNWNANALQVNCVRSAPAKSTGTTDSTQQVSQDRPGMALQVNSVQAGPQASSKSPQLGVFLTQEQIRGLNQLQQIKGARQIVLQASVPQASISQANGPQASVPQTSIPQASIPQASVPQASIPQAKLPQASIPQASVPQASIPQAKLPQACIPQASIPQASVPQASVPQASIPQANVPQASIPQPSVPQASVPPASVPQASVPQASVPQASVPQPSIPKAPQVVVQAGPSADKRKMTKEEYDDEVFNEAEWPGVPAPPAVVARCGPAGDVVLAARRGCWCVARHLVLREAPQPPARAALYELSPLRRLLLDEDEPSPPAAKQSKPGSPPAPPAAPPAPRPWLKVKAFAKMVDDGDAGQTTSQPTPAGAGSGEGAGAGLAARGVVLDGVAYLRLCDDPQVYAKVLCPVSGLREAGALLLRRAPLFLYAPHRAALAPLTGELDAQGASIVLTGPADMSEALGALALLLNPADAAPDAPTGPPQADPPADDKVVNVTGPKSFPAKQSKHNLKLVLRPKVVLNPQSSVDFSVKAVRVASDSDQETYHLILNDPQQGPVTRSEGQGEPKPVGGVIDLSSDEELSV